MKTLKKKILALALAAAILLSCCVTAANAAANTTITYSFTGKDSAKAGYAEGKITLTAAAEGTYRLFWADDKKALDGYYKIDEMKLKKGESKSYSFGNHVAIPKDATGIVALNSSGAEAARYTLPASKRLSAGSGKLNYTFNAYSDLHIDKKGYYKESENRWKLGLEYSVLKDTDFIVSAGDMVSNKAGSKEEWKTYTSILAESDYVHPVWESDGNHDLRNDPDEGKKYFIKYSGTDSTTANYDANKPYYYVVEKNSGDVFIFMALETASNPSDAEEFSSSQMKWVENLLKKYYNTGVNVYIIEHSPIYGFGAGDRMSKPFYKAMLRTSNYATAWFKSILINYPKLIFLSGHTHEDFEMGYNYSNENNTACHMLHIPAITGTTWATDKDTSLDYNDGKGRTSQGYYAEAFDNEVVFYGANITDKKIYPAYTYIMEGSREPSSVPETTVPVVTTPVVTEPVATGSTLPAGEETQRVYFANTLQWEYVSCYSTSSDFPGYGATYCGTDEYGVDLYYCDIPAGDDSLTWNNGGNGYKTVELYLDGKNNFYTPNTTKNSSSVTVTSSVWDYIEPSESTSTTKPTSEPTGSSSEPETTKPETSEPSSESTTAKETEAPTAEPTETSTDNTEPTDIGINSVGDADGNGSVDISDVTTIQKHVAKLIELEGSSLIASDTDFNGTVNIVDATRIRKYLAKYFASLEEEKAEERKPGIESLGESALTAKLNYIRQVLTTNYTFSSYDQYQALKELYYKYTASAPTDESAALSQIDEKLTKLSSIMNHINGTILQNVGDEYYFENSKGWKTVYCYAWSATAKNAEWPGAKLSKVGTQSGHDVYRIKFDSPSQYTGLIFSNGTDQTEDIDLTLYPKNCFVPNGTDSSGKYDVKNISYGSGGSGSSDSGTTVTPAEPTATLSKYAMYYYTDSHKWGYETGSKLSDNGNGTYSLKYTASGSGSLSMCIYNTSSKEYNCVSSSQSLTYEAGKKKSYSLSSGSSRGSSITIKGLSSGKTLNLLYTASSKTIEITCG